MLLCIYDFTKTCESGVFLAQAHVLAREIILPFFLFPCAVMFLFFCSIIARYPNKSRMTSNVQNNNDEMEDTNFLDHHLAFFVFLVVASLVFLISIVTLIFRKKLVEIGLCPRWILHVMAEERSPRQVNEGTNYYETERNERKDWYEYFLQPYTIIVKEEDFVLENDEDGNPNPKLRIQYPQDGTIIFFDSQCAICVSKYRRGDRIVWSGEYTNVQVSQTSFLVFLFGVIIETASNCSFFHYVPKKNKTNRS